ncbi:MAG: fimbrillin family protein [Alistipes sp.]|nr:fimbrillin family protein [Alistipes sp.]
MRLLCFKPAIAAVLALCLCACTKTDGDYSGQDRETDESRVAAVIQAGVGNSASTRAQDAQWDEDDAIGVAMLLEESMEHYDEQHNYHYITSSQSGIFEPHSAEMMIYFPANDSERVVFKAYYPYHSGLTSDMIMPLDVASQTALPDIDFMTARHIAGYTKSDPSVKLDFSHRLSKVIFNLSGGSEDVFGDLEDCTVTIRGMKTTANYDIMEESLSVDSDSDADITFPMREQANQRYGIVLPREADSGVEFDFTFATGATYTAKMSSDLELLGGYKYTFNINLSETPAEISAEIQDWLDGAERYYDAIQATAEVGENENVEVGTRMNVYVSGDNMDYSLLGTYEYTDEDTWESDEDIFWESISYDPAYMRASIQMEEPHDDSQTGDWLVSDPVTVQRNGSAHFKLTRAVSKLYVELRSDQFSAEDMENAVITLPDYYVGGYLENGEFIPGTQRSDIKMVKDEDTGYWVALFQPQGVSANGTVVQVELNGRVYKAEVETEGFEYRAGYADRFTIGLNKADVTISATVVDWILREPISWEAVQVTVDAGTSHGVEAGDRLDLYMMEGSTYTFKSYYIYGDDGKWTGNPPIYWEDIETYPATFKARMDVAGALNDTQLPDVMLSDPEAGYNNTGVDFELKHAAAKVIVALVSDTFTEEEMANATVTLPDYVVGGSFEGIELLGGPSTGDIRMVSTDNTNSVAIIQPQAIEGKKTAVRVNFGNGEYNAPAPEEGIVFAENVATTLIVRFEKGEISIGVSVLPWDTQTFELNALKVITGTGSTTGILDGEEMDVYITAGREYLTTYTWNGMLEQWTASAPAYWDDLGATQYFYASILRQEKYNDTMMDDYLLSGLVLVDNPDPVSFQLEHAMAQVAVELKSTDNFFNEAELANMKIILPNYLNDGNFDNGAFIQGLGKGNIEVEQGVGDDNNSALAFIIPQTVVAGDAVAVIVNPNNNNYEYTVLHSSDIVFEAGVTTILTINMKETTVMFSAHAADWETGPTINMVPSPIVIEGTLEPNDAFFEGQTIHIYNLTENSTDYTYTYSNGTWTGTAIYWDDYVNTGVELAAVYYPLGASIPSIGSGATSFGWQIPENQAGGWSMYDLLMAYQDTPAGTYRYINFDFAHVLSRVRVKLTSDEFSATTLANCTVTLANFILDGTAYMTTPVMTAGNTIGGTIIPYADQDSGYFEAIVMPQTIASVKTVVYVKVPGYDQPFEGTITSNLNFVAGKITTITVDLKLNEIGLSATLEDWTDGDQGTIIIQ